MSDETAAPTAEMTDPASMAPESTVTNERILNQDEIDSLLGFDLSDDDEGERTGIRAIINSALVSYERLKDNVAEPQIFTVPTEAMRRGDFSALIVNRNNIAAAANKLVHEATAADGD